MNPNEIVILPGIIVNTEYEKKIYIPFENINGVVEYNNTTTVYLKANIDDKDSFVIKEKINTIFSPERMARFSAEFGMSFIREVSEKMKVIKKFQGAE